MKVDMNNIVKFDGVNFDDWLGSLRAQMLLCGVCGHVMATEPAKRIAEKGNDAGALDKTVGTDETMVTDAELAKVEKSLEIAKGIIAVTVGPVIFEKLVELKHPKEMIEKMRTLYAATSQKTAFNLKAEFQGLTYLTDQSIVSFLDKLEEMQRKLAGSTMKLTDQELTFKAMMSLGAEWQAFNSIWRQMNQGKFDDWAGYRVAVLAEDISRRSMLVIAGASGDSTSEANSKSVFNASKPKFKGKCSNCNKRGHKRADCWAPGGGKAGHGGKYKVAASEVNKVVFHVELNQVNSTTRDTWILDTGATNHVVNNRELFVQFKEVT